MIKPLKTLLQHLSLCCGLSLLFIHQAHAQTPDPSDHQYLEKFMAYEQWSKQKPIKADAQFLSFIEETSPLTQKLRDKWLYQLAQAEDWGSFTQHYRPTEDRALRCYQQFALYQIGQRQQAISGAVPLWLSSQSQPKACDALFALLLQHHDLNRSQIDQRIKIALNHNETSLALRLIKEEDAKHQDEAKLISQISHDPKQIQSLHPGGLHGDIYLYGLKILVSRSMPLAIRIWLNPATKKIMNNDQQQQFLAHLALYKAMRNEEDAPKWFAQVQPSYCNDALRDWEIRYALVHQDWKTVLATTSQPNMPPEPNWQYWQARALEALNRPKDADALYQSLAKKRSYYGFLASLRLHQPLQFEHESTEQDLQTLIIYKPIIDQISNLYQSHQAWLASSLLNDFSSELSKSKKSTLTYWVAHHLHWPGKAVYLSSKDETLFNQLSLRFPLIYRSTVQQFAHDYKIPPALIYAMIRQESTFFEDSISPAGAYGLMQIMPRTAKIVSKQSKISYKNPNELFTSEKNIHIGTAYLQGLSKQFRAHPILMAAAYNAGPKQAQYWLRNHPPKDIDIWIETLPWAETRNYLKNVLSFYAVYQYRMHETPDLSAFMHPFPS